MKFTKVIKAGRPKNPKPIPNMKPFEEIRDMANKLYDMMLKNYNNKTPIVDENHMKDIYELRSILRKYTFNPFDENE